MPTDYVDIFVEWMGADFILTVDYEVTYKGARQTWDSPAEAAEWNTKRITLRRDGFGHGNGPAFDATGALFDCLADNEYTRERIEAQIELDYHRHSRYSRRIDFIF